MSDASTAAAQNATTPAVAAGAAGTAGAALRRARQAQGLHIAALAAALKVSPKKLELLESDRFAELPDATFVRALAQTVCRHLKIDAEPILSLLPAAGQPIKLENVTRGLNTPFREREARHDQTETPLWRRASVLAPVVLVAAAMGFWLWPQGWTVGDAVSNLRTAVGLGVGSDSGGTASAGESNGVAPATGATTPPAVDESRPAIAAAPAGTATPAAATPIIETVHQAPPVVAAASTLPGDQPAGMLVMRTTAESWVEVKDANGMVLLSRLLLPGESIGLDGTPPIRVKVGNAEGTQLSFRGKLIDLGPSSRDNVARVELK